MNVVEIEKIAKKLIEINERIDAFSALDRTLKVDVGYVKGMHFSVYELCEAYMTHESFQKKMIDDILKDLRYQKYEYEVGLHKLVTEDAVTSSAT